MIRLFYMPAFFGIIVFLFTLAIPKTVFAASETAYKDYLYQFDVYRQNLNEFKVARAEYLKFKTLVSQTTALEKTKIMLTQRDQLLRAYLLFLNEKIGENPSLSQTNKTLYQDLIRKEVTFLESHSKLIPEIQSITDAEGVSRQLTNHYTLLQSNIRQTIIALTYGELKKADQTYGDIMQQVQLLLSKDRSIYSPEKQSTMDRWLLQIQNKRSLYQQKIDGVLSQNDTLKTGSLDEINVIFVVMQKGLGEARQYLIEGTNYLKELQEAIRYLK